MPVDKLKKSKQEISVTWSDGRERWMSLNEDHTLPFLYCRYADEKGKWYTWWKPGREWQCVDGSTADLLKDKFANSSYGKLLDKAYKELLVLEAIENIVLKEEE